MKYLSLQQAMLGMRVTMTDDGLILKSPAGSAHYDLKGRRRTVWGDASFFPEHMRVKDKRKPNLSRVVFDKDSTTIYGPDGKAQIRMGNFEYTEKQKGWRIGDGEVFISNAFIGNGMVTSDSRMMKTHDTAKQHAAGMSISIEDGQCQATFSTVNDTAMEITLSESMRKAVIKAVSESELFKSIQLSIASQSEMAAALQKEMCAAVGDTIRKELSLGGAIWNQQRAR